MNDPAENVVATTIKATKRHRPVAAPGSTPAPSRPKLGPMPQTKAQPNDASASTAESGKPYTIPSDEYEIETYIVPPPPPCPRCGGREHRTRTSRPQGDGSRLARRDCPCGARFRIVIEVGPLYPTTDGETRLLSS